MKTMSMPSFCLSNSGLFLLLPHHHLIIISAPKSANLQSNRSMRLIPQSSQSPRFTVSSKCKKCKGQGAIECPGCKGTGKSKKNGNIFERWKCFECQGFGLKSCPVCGSGGLTPEQRGER